MTERANAAGGQDVGPLREEIQQLRAQLAEAAEIAGQETGRLRGEIETLREELERERSRNIIRRLVDAAQGTKTLRAEIEQLRTQLTEASQAVEQERANLQGSIGQLRAELEEERSRGFVRRLFGLRPQVSENPEDTREKMRGRLGVTLVWTLIAVVVGTYAYLLIGNLSPNDLNTVVPMVGATLLTPLVGLIGAVMGFYYGGQTAVQAASQTAEATKTAAQAATAVQSATAAQMIAQTTAQKATTPQSAAVAQKRPLKWPLTWRMERRPMAPPRMEPRVAVRLAVKPDPRGRPDPYAATRPTVREGAVEKSRPDLSIGCSCTSF